MHEGVVDVDGFKLFTRHGGEDGPALLFLHGFPQTGHCWRFVAEDLARDHRVIVPDAPGFGRSDAVRDGEVGTVAALLNRFLDVLGERDIVVVGHDWGGAFAIRLALDYPDRVRKLVITNSPYREMSLWRAWYIMFFNIPVLPEVVFRLAGAKLVAWALRAASTNKDVFDAGTIRSYQQAYATTERVRSALAYYRTTARRSLGRQLRGRWRGRGSLRPTGLEGSSRRIAAPTLVVWGMRDPVLTPALLPGIRRDIPDVEIVEVADCGHFVPEESPAALAEAIRTFV